MGLTFASLPRQSSPVNRSIPRRRSLGSPRLSPGGLNLSKTSAKSRSLRSRRKKTFLLSRLGRIPAYRKPKRRRMEPKRPNLFFGVFRRLRPKREQTRRMMFTRRRKLFVYQKPAFRWKMVCRVPPARPLRLALPRLPLPPSSVGCRRPRPPPQHTRRTKASRWTKSSCPSYGPGLNPRSGRSPRHRSKAQRRSWPPPLTSRLWSERLLSVQRSALPWGRRRWRISSYWEGRNESSCRARMPLASPSVKVSQRILWFATCAYRCMAPSMNPKRWSAKLRRSRTWSFVALRSIDARFLGCI
mmetsp:Transcript_52703/g.108892  ORF Transcript_52703/g.108892 Transcript_52703/m.108892 type:complete len:300 (+) Transcript_52703:307-1206(+)